MIWATRELVHFDRVASAWLIKRFIDKEADFVFLPPHRRAPADAISFGFAGAQFESHNGGATTFGRIVASYRPDDPVLNVISELVLESVRYVMNGSDKDSSASSGHREATLLGLTEGVMLSSPTDQACVEGCWPIYDALYARLNVGALVEAALPAPPASVLQQTVLLSKVIQICRRDGTQYSAEVFEQELVSARSTKY